MPCFSAAPASDPFTLVRSLGVEGRVHGVNFPIQDLKAVEPVAPPRLDRGHGVAFFRLHPHWNAVIRAMPLSLHPAVRGLKDRTDPTNDQMPVIVALPCLETDQNRPFRHDLDEVSAA